MTVAQLTIGLQCLVAVLMVIGFLNSDKSEREPAVLFVIWLTLNAFTAPIIGGYALAGWPGLLIGIGLTWLCIWHMMKHR